ncbi:MAG: YicC family protein [Sphingobacteriales bacterium]|nr:MAG: YicC family protein [Sphingobacteriales bacterium]
MLYSMTGYCKSSCSINNQNYTLEIKTLNSKQLDIYLKNATVLKDIEIELRKILTQQIIRGKVEIFLNLAKHENNSQLDFNAIKSLYNDVVQFANDNQIQVGDLLPTVIKLSENLKSEFDDISEEDKNTLLQSIENMLSELTAFRAKEGQALEIDILSRINLIRQLLQEIEPFEQNRIQKVREKLTYELQQININVDINRLEQELIFYIEKLDITEEKTRLQTHCNYFTEIVKDNSIEKGKKLGFIAQEIGREINTIGSKANDASMQKIVILMKDELEKIKEQLNNIL